MFNFYRKQKVHKYIHGEIEKSYANGDPKVYTVEWVDTGAIKLYQVPYVFFNHSGEVNHIDIRKCPLIVVNDRTKTANRMTWHTWLDAEIKPVEESIW